MPERKRVGFIGLGLMGSRMSMNLLKAGFPLTVWNRTREKMKPLLEAGAEGANSPREVAERSDVVIDIVTDSPDVEKVLLGPEGVIHGARPGLIVIDMSTISPIVTRRIAEKLAEKGVRMLDAPVSGGIIGAEKGTLSIMVGGDYETFKECLPIFEAMGKTITYCGGHGMGQMVKAVSGGAAGSWQLTNNGARLLRGDLEPGFKVEHLLKDLRIIMEVAREINMPLPGTALAYQLYRSLMAEGLGEKGTQAVIRVYEKLAGAPLLRGD